MEKLGKMVSCDRCGCKIFLEKTGEGETDGGYTRWDKFEQPEGWKWWSDLDWKLCPACSTQYEGLIQEFKKFPKVEEAGDENL